jgi:hypothetical protein
MNLLGTPCCWIGPLSIANGGMTVFQQFGFEYIALDREAAVGS